jgi:hypothetical protein
MAIISQNKLLVPGTGLTGTQSLLPVRPAEPLERTDESPNPANAISAEALAD